MKYLKKEFKSEVDGNMYKTACVKLTHDKSLTVFPNEINIKSEKANESFYVACGFVECEKIEFDNFYIDTVRNINEISKL